MFKSKKSAKKAEVIKETIKGHNFVTIVSAKGKRTMLTEQEYQQLESDESKEE